MELSSKKIGQYGAQTECVQDQVTAGVLTGELSNKDIAYDIKNGS